MEELNYFFPSNNQILKATGLEFLICYTFFRFWLFDCYLRSTAAGPWQISAKLPTLCAFSLPLYLPVQACTYMPSYFFCFTHTCISHSNLNHYFSGSMFLGFFVSSERNPFAQKEDSLQWRTLLWYMRFLNCPISLFLVFLILELTTFVFFIIDCSFQDCFLMCL